MDNDIYGAYGDYLYGGDDILDQLSHELTFPSLLDGADASPSEILAEAAPFLVPPISPNHNATCYPSERSSSDYSSDEEAKNSNYDSGVPLSSPGGSHTSSESCNELNLVDIEQFLQSSTDLKCPVVSIENGVIKINGIKSERDDEDNTVNEKNTSRSQVYRNHEPKQKSPKPQFKVENEHIVQMQTNASEQLAKKFVPLPIIIDHKQFLPPKLNGNVSPEVKNAKMPIPLLEMPKRLTNQQIKVVTNGLLLGQKPVLLKPKPIETPAHPSRSPSIDVSPEIDTSNLNDSQVRALKKQQRMIKNRESACQSRKKRKDYVSSLEQQLAEAQEEIARLRLENCVLKEQLAGCGHLARKVPRLDPSALMPRKNIAVIFAMVFMVSLNWNGFGWTSSPVKAPIAPASTSTRHLLWTDDGSSETNSEEQLGPLLNKSESIDCGNSTSSTEYQHINQTESIRLAGELQRWIVNFTSNERNYRNSVETDSFKDATHKEEIMQALKLFNNLNIPNSLLPINQQDLPKPNDKPIRRKMRLNRLRQNKEDIDPVVDFGTVYPQKYGHRGEHGYRMMNDFGEWSALLQALHRRDDTFYVVGVGKGEHLLLPAVAHNVTRPPKMALILPAKSGNDSHLGEDVTLMQIDCSVVNTSFVKLKADAIPESLRNNVQLNQPENLQKNRTIPVKLRQDIVDTSLLDILYNSSNLLNNRGKVKPETKKDFPKQDVYEEYFLSKQIDKNESERVKKRLNDSGKASRNLFKRTLN